MWFQEVRGIDTDDFPDVMCSFKKTEPRVINDGFDLYDPEEEASMILKIVSLIINGTPSDDIPHLIQTLLWFLLPIVQRQETGLGSLHRVTPNARINWHVRLLEALDLTEESDEKRAFKYKQIASVYDQFIETASFYGELLYQEQVLWM